MDPQGNVANTVVFLKDISSGKAMDLPDPRRFLDQKHCRYEPHILLGPENGPLQMKSSYATLHTVHMDGAATYNLPFPFIDQVVACTMPAAGLANVRCNGGHAWMNAEILVGLHPHYTVTDESGKFELMDVPPGNYEIVAWHEGWKVLAAGSCLRCPDRAQDSAARLLRSEDLGETGYSGPTKTRRQFCPQRKVAARPESSPTALLCYLPDRTCAPLSDSCLMRAGRQSVPGIQATWSLTESPTRLQIRGFVIDGIAACRALYTCARLPAPSYPC